MHLSPVLHRILTNLQLGPMRAIDLELAVYGTDGPEWASSNLRSQIVRLNRNLVTAGLRVVSDRPDRGSLPNRTRTRGTYRLEAVRPSVPLAHKQLDPEGIFPG